MSDDVAAGQSQVSSQNESSDIFYSAQGPQDSFYNKETSQTGLSLPAGTSFARSRLDLASCQYQINPNIPSLLSPQISTHTHSSSPETSLGLSYCGTRPATASSSLCIQGKNPLALSSASAATQSSTQTILVSGSSYTIACYPNDLGNRWVIDCPGCSSSLGTQVPCSKPIHHYHIDKRLYKHFTDITFSINCSLNSAFAHRPSALLSTPGSRSLASHSGHSLPTNARAPTASRSDRPHTPITSPYPTQSRTYTHEYVPFILLRALSQRRLISAYIVGLRHLLRLDVQQRFIQTPQLHPVPVPVSLFSGRRVSEISIAHSPGHTYPIQVATVTASVPSRYTSPSINLSLAVHSQSTAVGFAIILGRLCALSAMMFPDVF